MARPKNTEQLNDSPTTPVSDKVPFPQKKIQVTNIQCHIGVSLKANNAGGVVTGINTEKHKVSMELHPSGVIVRYQDGKGGKIIPYPNVQAIDVEFE